ncbi:FprA family A-type flavoprotein [Atopobium fossor]|uniref:FprA family A-type flavoprotein n=1 Tax=Atopobium fossor TaxID=39487 RepID=UPI0004826E19|nr:FprA family A-type flavoprotein [Atopobium fossor]
MHNVHAICDDTYWIGASDRRLALFENTYHIPQGMAYNSYVILDEKTCLLDGVDDVVASQFSENLDYMLGDRTLDYMVINHMEPDHCAEIPWLVKKFPNIKLVGTAKTFDFIRQFHNFDPEPYALKVTEGDTLELGKHILQFVTAPMVHWPEVMVTFDLATGTLFSADAFGEFGALGGNLFADEVNWERDWLDQSRSYYANIVGKYGMQVNNLLKKAAALPINRICPLHGHIWRKDLDVIRSKYAQWASFEPEEKSVVIYYGTIYGGTGQAADILAGLLAQQGVRDVRVYNTATADLATMVSEAFRASHLVFASSTQNMEIFDAMRTLVLDLRAHAMQKRHVALIENGSWAPQSGKLMREQFEAMKNITIMEPSICIRSRLDDETLQQITVLAEAIVTSLGEE